MRNLSIAAFVIGSAVGLCTAQSTPDEVTRSRSNRSAIDWGLQAELARQHVAFRAFSAAHPGWSALFDPRTRQPIAATGPGIQLVGPGASEAEIRNAAEDVNSRLVAGIWGCDPTQQALASAVRAGRLWYLHFVQSVGGMRIQNAGLELRIDESGRLVMFGGEIHATGDWKPRREISPAQACEATRMDARLTSALALQSAEVAAISEVIIVRETDAARVLVPCIAVTSRWDAPDGPRSWTTFVDAETGAVAESKSDVLSCRAEDPCPSIDGTSWGSARSETGRPAAAPPGVLSGLVTGSVHEGRLPWQTPVPRALPGVTVTVDGATTTSDGTGFYTSPTLGSIAVVSSLLNGPWVRCTAASPLANVTQLAPAGTWNVAFTDQNSTVTQRNLTYFLTKAHTILKARAPSNVWADSQLPGTLGGLTPGVAAFDPLTNAVQFSAAGNGIYDTATMPSLMVHEYGHFITVNTYKANGRIIPQDLGEGLSDAMGAIVENTPRIGDGWQGPGTVVRDLTVGCQWPSSCGTQIHQVGLILAGAAWDTRNLFVARYGPAGAVTFEERFYRHFAGTPLSFTLSILEMLLLDDDDGDVTNGTPNADLFFQGFTLGHGIPFPIPPVTIAPVPIQDSMDQYQSYRLQCRVTSLRALSTVVADVYWRLDGGSWTQQPMAPVGGSDWAAQIPVQPVGSIIDYYFQASDSASAVGTSPPSAPIQFHTLHVFRRTTVLREGFEANAGGWVSGAGPNPAYGGSGTNDWIRGVLTNTPHCIPCLSNILLNYDPHAAAEGSFVFATRIATANPPTPNGNVFWSTPVYSGNTLQWLDSPQVDCSQLDHVRLAYRRWLTVSDDGASGDRARIYARSASSTFTTLWQFAPGSGSFLDYSWKRQVLDLAAVADLQTGVQIRYDLLSDPGGSLGGWNVDDVRIYGHHVTRPPPLAGSGSQSPGGTFTLTVNGDAGDPYVIFASIALAPTFYPGFGMASIDVYDPASVIPIVLAGTIPAGGSANYNFVVPNAPGVSVHFQGIVGLDGTTSEGVITPVVTVSI